MSGGGQAPTPGGGPRRVNPALTFGLQFATGMALFSYLGYQLDRRRGGGIAWTMGGAILGLVYGAYELWKLLRSMPDDGRKDE